jgi:hypothetical protein
MKLESVRELKAAIADKVIDPASRTLRERSLSHFGTASISAKPAIAATVALGVARKSATDFTLAIRIQDRAFEGSRVVALIKKQAKGEVDIRYVGALTKRAAPPWHQLRQRPLLIGSSIGHIKVTAGTLGAFVRVRGTQAICVLSNNHVLANENAAKKGDAIIQPGAFDDGHDPADRAAQLTHWIALKKETPNTVDAAIAEIVEGLDADRTTLKGLGRLKGVGDVFLDEGTKVAKLGRTTGPTRGRVTAFELDNVVIRYDLGMLRFDNQIEIEGVDDAPFSRGGDSGSLIISEDLRAVGLLFAGGDIGGANGKGLTYANPIHAVLDALKIDLALE